MKIRSLTKAERELCERLTNGEVAEFGRQEVIKAEVLTAIARQIELPTGAKKVSKAVISTPAGIRVKGAVIKGRLDFRHCGTSGLDVLALDFKDCTFVGGVDGRGGCFHSLSFTGCRFRDEDRFKKDQTKLSEMPYTLHFADSHIAGTCNCSNALIDTDADHFMFSAEGAAIDGTVNFARAKLKAPPSDLSRPAVDSSPAALELTLARIDGDLSCLTETVIHGLVRMRACEISGDVWLAGATVGEPKDKKNLNQDPRSIFMQSVKIGGVLQLRGWATNGDGSGDFYPFISHGHIILRDAQVAGALHLEACIVFGNLVLDHANISDGVAIDSGRRHDARIEGYIFARNTAIGDNFSIAIELHKALQASSLRVGGHLDISALRMTKGLDSTVRLDLSQASIGNTLKLYDTDQRLKRSRRGTFLNCLSGFSLVETTWSTVKGEPANFVQVGFLINDKKIVRLDGQAQTLHALVKDHGHSVDDFDSAEEYLRLFCGYTLGAKGADPSASSSSFRVLPDPETYPPLLEFDRKAMDRRLTELAADKKDKEAARNAEKLRKALSYEGLEAFAQDHFKIERIEDAEAQAAGKFGFEVVILYQGHLFEAIMEVDAGSPDKITVEMTKDKVLPVLTKGSPRFMGAFTYPPDSHDIEKGAWRRTSYNAFATAPTVAGMNPSFPVDTTRLQPYVLSNLQFRGFVDLSGASCHSLDDYGGFAWGDRVSLKLNQFEYAKTSWNPSLNQSSNVLQRIWRGIKSIVYDRSSPAMLRRLDDLGLDLGDRSRSSWRIRRDWLRLQFRKSPSNHFNPARATITRETYNPQPLEHIIRVARSEGHEEYATRFEIEKRDIEWRMLASRQRNWMTFWGLLAAFAVVIAGWNGDAFDLAIRGLAVAASLPASMLVMRYCRFLYARLRAQALGDHLRNFLREFTETIRNVMRSPLSWIEGAVAALFSIAIFWREPDFLILLAFAATSALVIAHLSDIANFVMRYSFGYLRRPIRALMTLMGLFALGWWGVDQANERGMLVIDVVPVATFAAEEGQSVVIGSRAEPTILRDLACGDEISEPLYALDVLIPLVDLRQETECEIGQVKVPDRTGPINLPDSTDWWRAAKAFYAILGWIVVSLVIITFVNAFRTRNEP